MKKLIIVCVVLIATALTAYAAGFLETDASGNKTIDGFAPNGKKSVIVGVTRTGVDMRQNLAWQIYAGAAC